MSDIKLINKASIKNLYDKRIKEGVIVPGPEMCDVVDTVLAGKSGKIKDPQIFNALMTANTVGRRNVIAGDLARKYGSGFDIPRFCESKEKEMSVREMMKSGVFKDAKMSSNTLIPDWQSLWDVLRIDIQAEFLQYCEYAG